MSQNVKTKQWKGELIGASHHSRLDQSWFRGHTVTATDHHVTAATAAADTANCTAEAGGRSVDEVDIDPVPVPGPVCRL